MPCRPLRRGPGTAFSYTPTGGVHVRKLTFPKPLSYSKGILSRSLPLFASLTKEMLFLEQKFTTTPEYRFWRFKRVLADSGRVTGRWSVETPSTCRGLSEVSTDRLLRAISIIGGHSVSNGKVADYLSPHGLNLHFTTKEGGERIGMEI